MSSPDPTEHRPLLSGETPNTERNTSRSEQPNFSAVTLLIPITVLYQFAKVLTTTTNFRIYQIVACQFWYSLNDPGRIPRDLPIPDELCLTNEVRHYSIALFSTLAIACDIASILGCGACSYLASRFGRKPVFLGLLFIASFEMIIMLILQTVRGWQQLTFFSLWIICELFGNPSTTRFLINIYIVDLTDAKERSAALTKIAGWATLGPMIAFFPGHLITTTAHNTILVYIISLILLLLSTIYVFFALPESFSEKKREKLRLERADVIPPTSQLEIWMRKLRSWTAIIFEPLEQLKPTYNTSTGRRSWRLIYCAIHAFAVSVADGYLLMVLIIYLPTQYKHTAAPTGYILTIMPITSIITLIVFVPVIIRYLRPFYRRNQTTASLVGEEGDNTHEATSNEVDHLDVHITVGSWAMESIAYIAIGVTNAIAIHLPAAFFIGLSAGRNPVLRSLVAASVDPLRQGDAMASVEMFSHLGLLFSPMVMGSILKATIRTAPETAFYVHGAIVAFGVAVLFLVRDSDGFQQPAIVLESDPED